MSKKIRSLPRSAVAQRKTALSAEVAAVLALSGTAGAFEIDTGNEDLSIRFDNTLRINSR